MYYDFENVAPFVESRVLFLTFQVLCLLLLLIYADRKSKFEVTCCVIQFVTVLALTGSIVYNRTV